MTKEEILQTFGDINHDYNDCTKYDILKRMLDKLTEPCDCINRTELLKAVDTWDKFGCDANNKLVRIKDCYVPYIRYDDVVKAIKGMPSIQPKTGHWIATEKDWWKCSECGQVIYSETEQDRQEYHAYCGRCGAKMLPTDSEKE